MKSHPNSSVPLKLTSPTGPKKVCIRTLGLATLMPDCPPSPKMVTNQPLLLLKACVPLSCVPPMISLRGACALTERLWNWSVATPLFSDEIFVGTFDNQRWQSTRSAPERPRDEH